MDDIAADVWLVLPPLLILVGLFGIVVPVLPGMLLIVAGMLTFALVEQSVLGWVLLALTVLVAGTGQVLQYLVPGRRMRERGVRTSTLVLAVALAIVGFFVIPVVGALVGFVGGIWLVETGRGAARGEAWRRTRHAVVAVAQSIGIELVAGLSIAGLYVVGAVIGATTG
ncbi:DUF456 domain-containing protein [Phycicoccus sp. BSK3Z-2]|uniref:DUF456 domain-containing protein n=1 Tax=Phycicoccus avicenniae TaxID=2828860 RepID=A0A941D936_9MICO|nr:DUF456 domain-containing protein [Phycicoccus avicenniae]MBR7743100.1 DUF456 domain-containing protein [Phycicoccus avicenniae]